MEKLIVLICLIRPFIISIGSLRLSASFMILIVIILASFMELHFTMQQEKTFSSSESDEKTYIYEYEIWDE